MRMLDFINRKAIIPEVTSTTKEEVIRELIGSLVSSAKFKGTETEDIVKAVLKRESMCSTGIGRGIAIPHTKHAAVEKLVGTLAVSKPGLKFDSLDGAPVHVFVLLLSPDTKDGLRDHLLALQHVVQKLRDDGLVSLLRQAQTADAIWDLVSPLE